MSDRALTVAGINAVQVTVDPAAYQTRYALLFDARAVTAVDSEFAQDLAVGTLKDLKTLLKLVEDSRKEVKAPVISLGRSIDTEATKFCEPLEAEANRLARLIASFQERQRLAAENAERLRQAELARIEQERRAAEEAARKAAAEAQAKATSTAEAVEAERKARLAAQEAEEKAKQEKARAFLAAAPVPVAKPKGLSVTPTLRFEVTDVLVLFTARPELVDLVPKTAAINAALRGGDREIPGLRVWEETRVGVRA